MNTPASRLVDTLNRECDCSFTDFEALRDYAHFFSAMPVFLEEGHAAEMRSIVGAVEAVVGLADYPSAVLKDAPSIAKLRPRTSGAFMGFDFHISPSGPRLIEINTNAGGALLNIAAREAQRACCSAADEFILAQPGATELEREVIAMFEREWRLARGNRPLRTIAIVDDKPRGQFLYPEFELARNLFESRGIHTLIVDPEELETGAESISARGEPIDLIYNRVTDFYFEEPRHEALRWCYQRDLAVITPHPHAHALYANKRNLAILSDAAALERLGAPREAIDVLTRGVPSTRDVRGCEETWWNDRKRWFFKPQSGYGSRGAYRGDKLTRKVFAEIVKGEYVAQQLVPPSERQRSTSEGKQSFKLDVRCYVYEGKIQLMAARVYQGQTTNFRTAGGGFAPVYVVTPAAGSLLESARRNTRCAN